MKNIILPTILILFFINGANASNKPIEIITSFTILKDMVCQIGKDKVHVDSLINIGEEVHDFQPSPKDAIKLSKANIIVINGLSFEGWIGKLIKASKTNAKLLVASAGINPRWINNETPDPHAWLSIKNAIKYIKNITFALIKERPQWKSEFKENARNYINKLIKLDKETTKAFMSIPKEKRKLITNHDAFGYFARDYNIQIKPIIGLNPHEEPSPKRIASIINFIKSENVKTIFIENLNSNKLIKQIAKDTNIKISRPLFTGSLTKKKGIASTYLNLIKTNTNRIKNGMND